MKALRDYLIQTLDVVAGILIFLAVLFGAITGYIMMGLLGAVVGIAIGFLSTGLLFGFWCVHSANHDLLKRLVELSEAQSK